MRSFKNVDVIVPFMDLLREIGLTGSEISVYQALIKTGSTTTGPLVKEAKISSGKIYEVLDKLVAKGLVTHIFKSGRKYFQATNPERLLDYVDNKQSRLETIKPELRRLVTLFEQERHDTVEAEIFEGVQGFKAFSEFCLRVTDKKSDYRVLGVSREVNERFGGYLLNWHRRRIAKGITIRFIYNSDAQPSGKLREHMPFTSVRYLPKGIHTPALIEIFDDYVATVIVLPKPVIFLIKSKEAAESHRRYFEMMWNQALKR